MTIQYDKDIWKMWYRSTKKESPNSPNREDIGKNSQGRWFISGCLSDEGILGRGKWILIGIVKEYRAIGTETW